jgi:hypothetical protein
MSSRFFTNHGEQTLLKKFQGIFDNNPDIEWFDALVGFSRASGYFAIRPHLEKVPHIRILVGINVDVRLVSGALADRVGLAPIWLLNPLSHSETIERYRSEVADAVEAIAELSNVLEVRIAASPWSRSDLFKERDGLVKLLNWESPEQRQ